MQVTSIKPYTPIRQEQSFAGNKRKKDVPDKKEPGLQETLDTRLEEIKKDKNFWRRWKRMEERVQKEIEERRLSSIVPPEKLKEPMTI